MRVCPQRRPARTSRTPDEPHIPLGPPPPETAYEASAPPSSSPSSQETPKPTPLCLRIGYWFFRFLWTIPQICLQYSIDDHESFTVFALRPFWREIQNQNTVYHWWSWIIYCFRFETILARNSNSNDSIPLMIMYGLLFSLWDQNSNYNYSIPSMIMNDLCFRFETILAGNSIKLKIQYTIDDHESFTVFALKPFWREIQI